MTPWLSSALVNHLWQSTLFVVVVWLATVALRQNRARVRYWLWTAASVKFLLPVSALVSLGAQFEWRTAPASVQPAVSFVMQEVLAPAVVAVAASASSPQSSSVFPWLLLAVWVAGATAVLASWWRQWLPIRSALRQATPVRLDTECNADDLAVMSTPSMFEPGVIGIFRPVVLLPGGLVERLNAAQMRALIAHERCHIRCGDNLMAAMQMVVEALFWFHPLVWWIESRMIDERERACDEAVLRSGSHPRDYAEGILEVCRSSVASPLMCVAGVSGSNLRRRLEAIIRGDMGAPLTVGRRLALVCAAAFTIGGPVASGAVKLPVDVQADVIGPRPKFEVASVKRNQSLKGPYSGLEFLPGGRVRAVNAQLAGIIASAYRITHRQLDEGQFDLSGFFDIDARAGASALPDDAPQEARWQQLRLMVQDLLADRFKLTLHKETREVPVYALVVASGGPRLTPSPIDRQCEPPSCGGMRAGPASGLTGRGVPISALPSMLNYLLDREVIDRTGIEGLFDIDLPPWSRAAHLPNNPDGDEPAPNPSDPSIFTVLQEQLGLRLESIRAPREIYVVDRIEPPTPD